MTSLPEYVAEAVLELLQSVPKPDKADLSVCIERAMGDHKKIQSLKPVSIAELDASKDEGS